MLNAGGPSLVHCNTRPAPVNTPDAATEMSRERCASAGASVASPLSSLSGVAFSPAPPMAWMSCADVTVLPVSDHDFSTHEIHLNFAHASQWFERALDGLDFICTIHSRDTQSGLLAGLRGRIQRSLARFFVMPAVVVFVTAASAVVSVLMFVAHRFCRPKMITLRAKETDCCAKNVPSIGPDVPRQ